MSTLYQSSKDVPTEVLSARLDQLSDVVSSNRERIDAEFAMRIPAEVDRDADLVMSEAAVRLEALQAECERLRKDAATERAIQRAAGVLPPGYRIEIEIEKDAGSVALFAPDASVECDFQGGIAEQIADAIDAALQGEQS